MSTSQKHTPKSFKKNQRILERYLPPFPDGFAENWIKLQSLKGIFILDPFGASPELSVRAAQNGNRVLVAANNPILSLLIEVTANPPTPAQSRTALSSLAALRVRDERVELHIQALYQTTCPNCKHEIFAQAFLWERDAKVPYARILQCILCNTAGEFSLTADDLQRATKFRPGGLHHARALGRIAPPHDQDRIHVEEALNVYPPRAVYALLTLVNKIDFLDSSREQERILMTMLLSAFDQANTLWPHPVARVRPGQLTIPPTFRENNLWLALDKSVDIWEPEDNPVPITYWPELPPESGGICLYKGRIKELADQADKIEFKAILTAFPRPNQAFWSLSALWAGWLWGHEAVEHFKPVLRRRRYDWAWHSTATYSAIKSLIPVLAEKATFNGLIGEAEPGFVSAVIIAAEQVGLQIDKITVYSDKKLVQICWKNAQQKPDSSTFKGKRAAAIQTAGREYLRTRGEPSQYLKLHIAILAELGRQGLLTSEETPAECYNKLQQEIQETLNYQNGFLRYEGSEKSLEVGKWWLANERDADTPLSDRVEMALVQYLLQNPNCSFTDVESTLFQRSGSKFAGLLVPDTTLIYECLESYGELIESGWHFRNQDLPSKRREEITSMVELISGLGSKLGFRVRSQLKDLPHSIWLDENNTPRYVLYLSASALLGKFFLEVHPKPARCIIVVPGGRANLVMFKLNRDPRLKNIFEQDWCFLKYRHARQLAHNPSLTTDTLESQLVLDPMTYTETQLRMF